MPRGRGCRDQPRRARRRLARWPRRPRSATGLEDGIYFRYSLDLTAALGTFTQLDAIRIAGDHADRVTEMVLDSIGDIHIVGDTASTFSQLGQGSVAGPVDAMYIRFTP